MLRWETLTHMVLHTSSQVRILIEMPRAKLSHLSSWHDGSHRLEAHSPCFSSKDQRQSHHRAAHRPQLPAARWVQTRLLQYRELHAGLSLFLPTTETIIAQVVKKKQYLWGILGSIATLIYMFYYATNLTKRPTIIEAVFFKKKAAVATGCCNQPPPLQDN